MEVFHTIYCYQSHFAFDISLAQAPQTSASWEYNSCQSDQYFQLRKSYQFTYMDFIWSATRVAQYSCGTY